MTDKKRKNVESKDGAATAEEEIETLAEKNNRHRRRGGLGCSVKWKRNGKKTEKCATGNKKGNRKRKNSKKGRKKCCTARASY
mgnify:FL=1